MLLLSGCATARNNPLNRDVTDAFGCERAQIEQEWQNHRYQMVTAGQDACVLLGRFGLPDHMTRSSHEGAVTAMLTWDVRRSMNHAMIAKYSDTPMNRQLGRPIGRWVVENFSVTSF